ncbi:hypothetical protein PC114_g20472 [Phytophthora cactorum]|nr:hypothetical protein PC114_g20472 [Phytophthora cactorum]
MHEQRRASLNFDVRGSGLGCGAQEGVHESIEQADGLSRSYEVARARRNAQQRERQHVRRGRQREQQGEIGATIEVARTKSNARLRARRPALREHLAWQQEQLVAGVDQDRASNGVRHARLNQQREAQREQRTRRRPQNDEMSRDFSERILDSRSRITDELQRLAKSQHYLQDPRLVLVNCYCCGVDYIAEYQRWVAMRAAEATSIWACAACVWISLQTKSDEVLVFLAFTTRCPDSFC